MARHASDARGHHMRMLGGRFVPICNWLAAPSVWSHDRGWNGPPFIFGIPAALSAALGTLVTAGTRELKQANFFIALANKIYDDMGPAMKI